MYKYNPDLHHRRSIRLRGYDYSQEGLYFVTVCTQHRECLFGEIADGEMRLNKIGRIVEDEWLCLSAKYPNIDLLQFVIMPNHFHGILQIVGAGFARPVNNVPNNYYGYGGNNGEGVDTDKAGESQRADRPRPYVPTLGNMIAYFKYQTTKQINLPAKLWQRNYHEHIIRDCNDHARIADYIERNPVNWDTDCFYNS